MLTALRRLLSRGPKPADAIGFQHWADARGHQFMRVRHGCGCVIQGRQGAQEWRIEWGNSQRAYIAGLELRLIAELGLPRDLMVLVLNQVLMEAMERAVYEQFVDDVQTRIDTETPAEMRWLVLHPKLAAAELGRLRGRFGAAGSVKPWVVQWLNSSLGDALVASLPLTAEDVPVVLTIHRGRLTLRTVMPTADAAGLTLWFSVFEHALREAKRLGSEWREAAAGGVTTQPSAWSASALEPPRPARAQS